MGQVLKGTLPAANTASVTDLGEVSGVGGTDVSVARMELIPSNAFTGVATNNLTVNIRQLRAGTAVQTLGSVTLDNTKVLTADNPLVVAQTAGGSSPLQIGDVIDAQVVVNGTGGTALPAGMDVEVEVA